jgi:hypothetical protein
MRVRAGVPPIAATTATPAAVPASASAAMLLWLRGCVERRRMI